MGRDSATFWDNGTEVPSLSRDKATTGQAQNLAIGQNRMGQPKFGTGWAGTAKIRDGAQDKTGRSRKRCSKTGKRCSKTENEVMPGFVFWKNPGHIFFFRDLLTMALV